MNRIRKQIKIRNRLREISEQKNNLLHNLNFVAEKDSIFYFEQMQKLDQDISESYRQLKSS